MCKVFLKADNADCLGSELRDAQRMLCTPSVMVLELLGLYSLPRKQHSLALIRARAQGLSVEVDSHDFSGHW